MASQNTTMHSKAKSGLDCRKLPGHLAMEINAFLQCKISLDDFCQGQFLLENLNFLLQPYFQKETLKASLFQSVNMIITLERVIIVSGKQFQ